jgi:hypothetical protein
MSLTIPVAAVQYVECPLVFDADPLGDSVYIAFPTTQTATGATWNAASWRGPVSGTYYARVLVGVGGVVLAAGTYHVYSKIVDNPETPITYHGTLTVEA